MASDDLRLRDPDDDLPNVLLALKMLISLLCFLELEHPVNDWVDLACGQKAVHILESAESTVSVSTNGYVCGGLLLNGAD